MERRQHSYEHDGMATGYGSNSERQTANTRLDKQRDAQE